MNGARPSTRRNGALEWIWFDGQFDLPLLVDLGLESFGGSEGDSMPRRYSPEVRRRVVELAPCWHEGVAVGGHIGDDRFDDLYNWLTQEKYRCAYSIPLTERCLLSARKVRMSF
jgi:hypothetical protein